MEFADRKLSTPRGEVVLRKATAADNERYRDLRLTALQTSPEAFGSAYEDAVREPPEDWLARLARPNAVPLVVDNGTELVAMAGILRNSGPKVQHTGFIWGVFVRPAWRGLGLAEAMMQALIDVARGTPGWRKLDLAVVTTNEPALRLYERLGFRIYGTNPQELFVGGVYYDEHLMYLQLDHQSELGDA